MPGFLKGAGMFALWLLAIVAICFIALALVHGMAWVSDAVYPIIVPVAGWTFVAMVILLLPMSFIRPLRGAAVIGLMIASLIFGITTWVFGFLVAYGTWGVMGIVIGLVMGGVGVVPVAIVACLWHGAWSVAVQLIVGIVLTFGVRVWSAYVGGKAESDRVSGRFATTG